MERAEAMTRRVLVAATRAGVAETDLGRVGDACRGALAARDHLDEHHPDRLHAARTLLILVDDVGLADPIALAAAALLDTWNDDHPGADRVGPEVLERLRVVPTPSRDGERLAESLLEAPEEARLIALAERLDHARHLHLRDAAEWHAFHTLTERVYAPIATRSNPTLARRFAWWCAMFRRRFLRS